jgi:hypothetical protein
MNVTSPRSSSTTPARRRATDRAPPLHELVAYCEV